jgi:hypothetical protein
LVTPRAVASSTEVISKKYIVDNRVVRLLGSNIPASLWLNCILRAKNKRVFPSDESVFSYLFLFGALAEFEHILSSFDEFEGNEILCLFYIFIIIITRTSWETNLFRILQKNRFVRLHAK